MAVLPWSRGDAVEQLVEVGETADVLAVDGERQLLDACGSAADAGGVGVAAGAKKLRQLFFGSPTVYPYLRPMTRYLCAGVGVVVRTLINILAGRECACVWV